MLLARCDRRGDVMGMTPDTISLDETFASIGEHWQPRIVGELNGQHVKVAKLLGEFMWHHHEHEDELFLVHRGRFRMEFRDRVVEVGEGEMVVVPRGVEHRPVAEAEVELMLFEPAGTRNTGNIEDSPLTAPNGVRI